MVLEILLTLFPIRTLLQSRTAQTLARSTSFSFMKRKSSPATWRTSSVQRPRISTPRVSRQYLMARSRYPQKARGCTPERRKRMPETLRTSYETIHGHPGDF
ncbi:hypothetical protein EDB84DRAFT_569746 [Lactarius hengduanensis]|nr:hypothetical protein EDB84DRAFT_569746 [Lactarius hengduanensis]